MSEFYDDAIESHYPFHDAASKLTDGGLVTPRDIIADCRLIIPSTVGKYGFVSGIILSENLVSVVFSVSDLAPNTIGAEVTTPAAAISELRRSIIPYKPYALTPLRGGCGGWVVFGDIQTESFKGQYSSTARSGLVQRCVFSYPPPGVPSISKEFAIPLTGAVELAASGDITVRATTFLLDGEPIQALAIGLRRNTPRNTLEFYRGVCQGRPESDTCLKPIITSISQAVPDCSGNIDIEFRGFDVGSLASGGVVIDIRGSVRDGCNQRRALPDADGRLPDDPDYIFVESSIIPRELGPPLQAELLDSHTTHYLPDGLTEWFDIIAADDTNHHTVAVHRQPTTTGRRLKSIRITSGPPSGDIDVVAIVFQLVGNDLPYSYTSVELSRIDSELRVCWNYGDSFTVLTTTPLDFKDAAYVLQCDIVDVGNGLRIRGALLQGDSNTTVDFVTRAPVNSVGRFGFSAPDALTTARTFEVVLE